MEYLENLKILHR